MRWSTETNVLRENTSCCRKQASNQEGDLVQAAGAHPGPGNNFLIFEDRRSDSPFIERVWRSHTQRAGTFLSVASSKFEMVVTRQEGKVFLTVRGPETQATTADCPANGEWLGIRFKLGTYMPRLLPATLINRNDVTLPAISDRGFWLNGSRWQYPTFENAEAFVRRLERAGIIWRDPTVDTLLYGPPPGTSLRSAQRRFLKWTGMTQSTFRQIERARFAAGLLRQGVSIADTVYRAGFFDQAHMTRSVKHLIGHTPARIIRGEAQLSFLYNTEPTD
jgi:hypothetical protein